VQTRNTTLSSSWRRLHDCYGRSKHGTLEHRWRRKYFEEPSTGKSSGQSPDIQLLRHPQRTTNTTFRDRHPNIPLLALRQWCHRTQPHIAQAEQGKLIPNNGRLCQHLRPLAWTKSHPPSETHIDRDDNLAALARQDCHPSQPSHKSASWKCWLPWFPRPPPRRISTNHSGCFPSIHQPATSY
jgi:hypothetical protein